MIMFLYCLHFNACSCIVYTCFVGYCTLASGYLKGDQNYFNVLFLFLQEQEKEGTDTLLETGMEL